MNAGSGNTVAGMGSFETPTDLTFNRGLVADPSEFARDNNAAAWLFLCGEDFAQTEGGISFANVQNAVSASVNIAVDTVPLTMDVARQGIAALDELPRPTLVTCRTGPKSSALVYLYAGIKAGASTDDVLARAEADGAPFIHAEPLKAWVAQGLDELR
jgi:protein tyrosine phosphatase (PTP) superfamily phosphohydrolase (DUF442 family)